MERSLPPLLSGMRAQSPIEQESSASALATVIENLEIDQIRPHIKLVVDTIEWASRNFPPQNIGILSDCFETLQARLEPTDAMEHGQSLLSTLVFMLDNVEDDAATAPLFQALMSFA